MHLPYVLFVDLNVPANDLAIDEQPWMPVIERELQLFEDAPEGSPFTAVIFTNIPYEFGPELFPQGLRSAYCKLLKNPRHSFKSNTILKELGDAIMSSTDIPTNFHRA
ncbi:hypothetical protein D3C86_1962380 [compost metagenome]